MQIADGYKQTEVGVIPEDWCASTIGQAFAIDNHLRLPLSRDVRKEMQGKHPYYGPTKIQDYINEYRVEGTYALIGEDGDHFLKWEDQPMTLLVRGKFNVNNHAHLVRGCDNTTEWFFYFFQHRDLTPFLTRQGAGRFKLSKASLVVIPIALPPLAEQRAIAEALSDVDALINALDALITKKRHIKQGTMQQLLTGKKRLPGFGGEWDETIVESVITKYFCGPSPTCEERNVSGTEEWGVLKTTAATKQHGWNWKKHKVLPRSFWGRSHIELRIGDVIVTKAGPRHRVGVAASVYFVPPRIVVSGKMIGLRPNPQKVISLMLAAAVSAPNAQQYLNQRTTGMAESQLNYENGDLLKTPIRLPGLKEQVAIAEVLSDMDAEITALEQKRDKTKLIKQGMMQELLTGKTRLI